MRHLVLTLCLAGTPLGAQTPPPEPQAPAPQVVPAPQPPAPAAEAPMTLERMGAILRALDPDTVAQGPGFALTISDVPVLIITDVLANRMRAMVPIRSAEGMTQTELLRVMQANFDSTLDARYAVAQGRLWGVFIHPLSELQRDQLISGLAQAVNVALSYGTAYASGGILFGGGDSGEIQRQDLLRELLRRGQPL